VKNKKRNRKEKNNIEKGKGRNNKTERETKEERK
jgi:hypothetical protein